MTAKRTIFLTAARTAARTASLAAALALAAAVGWLANDRLGAHAPHEPESAASPARGASPCADGAPPLYWKAPMDPTYVRDAPGKSPMGMDLVPECARMPATGATDGVAIDPVVVQNMGVRTAIAQRRDLARAVRAVGRVAWDERRVSHVHTKVQGWIEALYVEYEGQLVRKGDPMIELYSPELLATQEELIVAARYRDETAKSPFDDVRRAGASLFEATRRRLDLWDVPERDIEHLLATGVARKTLTLHAHSSGVVTHLGARMGMEVNANEVLYTIADLSRVWVLADVYEYELPWIEEGQSATVDVRSIPGRSFRGTVAQVYPFLDPRTRTARVRVELANSDLALKPDMFANVVIETTPRAAVVAVPSEAVIRTGERAVVVRALGEGRFDPRAVEVGVDGGDGWVEIAHGIEAGDRVVTSGQFLIDSESRLRESLQKLLAREE